LHRLLLVRAAALLQACFPSYSQRLTGLSRSEASVSLSGVLRLVQEHFAFLDGPSSWTGQRMSQRDQGRLLGAVFVPRHGRHYPNRVRLCSYERWRANGGDLSASLRAHPGSLDSWRGICTSHLHADHGEADECSNGRCVAFEVAS